LVIRSFILTHIPAKTGDDRPIGPSDFVNCDTRRIGRQGVTATPHAVHLSVRRHAVQQGVDGAAASAGGSRNLAGRHRFDRRRQCGKRGRACVRFCRHTGWLDDGPATAGTVELKHGFAVFDIAAARVKQGAVIPPLQEQNRIRNGAAGGQNADCVQGIAASSPAFVVDHDNGDATLESDALKLRNGIIDLSALSSLQASKAIE
jgi:hypothetical protein